MVPSRINEALKMNGRSVSCRTSHHFALGSVTQTTHYPFFTTTVGHFSHSNFLGSLALACSSINRKQQQQQPQAAAAAAATTASSSSSSSTS